MINILVTVTFEMNVDINKKYNFFMYIYREYYLLIFYIYAVKHYNLKMPKKINEM